MRMYVCVYISMHARLPRQIHTYVYEYAHTHTHTAVTYVSSHIHYMLTELLKNSLRAVVDQLAAEGGKV